MDDKLHKLGEIKSPPPSEEAKNLALGAAMEAFSQGKKENTSITHSNNQNLWSKMKRFFNSPGQLKLAGAVASLAFCVLLSHSLLKTTYEEQKFDGVAGTKESTIEPVPQKDLEAHRQKDGAQAYGGSVAESEQPTENRVESIERFEHKSKQPEALIVRTNDSFELSRADAGGNDMVVLNDSLAPKVKRERSDIQASQFRAPKIEEDRDKFENISTSSLKLVKTEPVSTFSADVDTASYTYVRRALEEGRIPPASSVRVEEMVNYFKYDYATADSKEEPFKPTVALYQTPWNENTRLLHIGIKGYELPKTGKPQSNLVFLIDVSGSMSSQDKLPLLKSGFKMMVNNLDAEDTVAIVTYAGNAGTVLEPTSVSEKSKILSALENLNSGGSTAGAAGIEQAYRLAEQSFVKDGVNRVILATDGDFNVGTSNPDELKRLIEKKRKSGIFLSVLGFGQGNYNDHIMQSLAQNGNGNASYIDSLTEAQKVLVDEASGTLFTIAKDVKFQVEFNPDAVSEYRLIGYETRELRREDFNNDKIDAGDIGSGHTVTAIYEITPVGAKKKYIDELRYGDEAERSFAGAQDEGSKKVSEYAFLKMRYKLPNEDKSTLITLPVTKDMDAGGIAETSHDVQFAAAVAAFGQLLRGENIDYSYDQVLELAKSGKGSDESGYRAEFINLVKLAKGLEG